MDLQKIFEGVYQIQQQIRQLQEEMQQSQMELLIEMQQFKNEMRVEMHQFKDEMRVEMHQFKDAVHEQLHEFRKEMNAGFDNLGKLEESTELYALKSWEFEKDIHQLKKRVSSGQ